MKLTDRQLATTLAALRFWQRMTTHPQRTTFQHYAPLPEQVYFEDVTPLKDGEIDRLCERFNTVENTIRRKR